MLDERDKTRLQHMLAAARKAVRLAQGRQREDLEDEDDPLVDALMRLISVIGEAANKVSPTARALLSDVPWPDVVSMRHRLVHDYFDVNLDILWATVVHSLPPLIEDLEGILPSSRDQ